MACGSVNYSLFDPFLTPPAASCPNVCNAEDEKAQLDRLVSKLKGCNDAEKAKALTEIIDQEVFSRRLIPSLLTLLESNDPAIFGKTALLLYKYSEKGLLFVDQRQAYEARFNFARVTYHKALVTIKGQGVVLPGGAVLQDGTITIGTKSGKMGVIGSDRGDFAVINGVRLTAEHNEKFIVDLHANREETQIDYVSLDPHNRSLTVNSHKATIRIELEPGNNFVGVKNGQYLAFTVERAAITFNNSNPGLLPQVNIRLPQSGYDYFLLESGNRYCRVLRDYPNIDTDLTIHKQSVPVALTFQKDDGRDFPENNLLSGTKLFDGSNHVLFFAEDVPQGIYNEVKAHAADFDRSPKLTKYTEQQLLEKFDVDFEAVPGASLMNNVYYNLSTLPPDLQLSIRQLIVAQNSSLPSYCQNDSALGCAKFPDRKIFLKKMNAARGDLLAHEASHLFVRGTDPVSNTAPKPLIDHLAPPPSGQPLSRALTDTSISPLTPAEIDQLRYVNISDSLLDQWRSVAGNVYGQGLAAPKLGDKASIFWNDGSKGPRHGCICAYGANNPREDIATFVEQIVKSPSLLRELVSPNPDNPEYDPRYLVKVILLHEHGLITEDQFTAVTARRGF